MTPGRRDGADKSMPYPSKCALLTRLIYDWPFYRRKQKLMMVQSGKTIVPHPSPTRDYLRPVISDRSTSCDLWVQEQHNGTVIAVTPSFTTTMWNSTGIRFISSWDPFLYWLNCWGLGKFCEDSHSKSACQYQLFTTIKYVSLQRHENSSYFLKAGFLSKLRQWAVT